LKGKTYIIDKYKTDLLVYLRSVHQKQYSVDSDIFALWLTRSRRLRRKHQQLSSY